MDNFIQKINDDIDRSQIDEWLWICLKIGPVLFGKNVSWKKILIQHFPDKCKSVINNQELSIKTAEILKICDTDFPKGKITVLTTLFEASFRNIYQKINTH